MVLLKTFIDEDLGHVSYIVGCEETKEVAIVDPRRDIDEYVEYIRFNDLAVKYVLNTHTHADYIGGHLELLDIFNPLNIFHHSVPAKFDYEKAQDGDTFSLGKTVRFKVIETPGHTPFCISFTLNEEGIDKAIFTGDALFVGDIGRPDLLGDESLLSLAQQSYQTAKRFYGMNEGLMIFASHISGSFCGKNLKNQYFSTIGIEKVSNESLKHSQNSQQEYVDNIIGQNIETPEFFKKMAGINIEGPVLLKNIPSIEMLGERAFMEVMNKGQIVDLRHPNSFHMSHIPNSINLYEEANVSLLAGSLLDYEKDIYLVGDKKSDYEKFVTKLRRVGLDNVKAIFKHDVNSLRYIEPVSSSLIYKKEIEQQQCFVINLYQINLQEDENTVNSELSQIKNLKLPIDKKIVINCKQGYKSSLALSYLCYLGYQNVCYVR